jgi:hypothetical protein
MRVLFYSCFTHKLPYMPVAAYRYLCCLEFGFYQKIFRVYIFDRYNQRWVHSRYEEENCIVVLHILKLNRILRSWVPEISKLCTYPFHEANRMHCEI